MAFEDLDPGDETRRNGDYIGFPHGETDGTAIGDISGPTEGEPVTYDGTSISSVVGDGTSEVAGVVYTYDYYGSSTGAGPMVSDNDVTVKTRGSVVADLTAYADGTATVAVGGTLGPNGEIYVVEEIDAANNLYEVLVR